MRPTHKNKKNLCEFRKNKFKSDENKTFCERSTYKVQKSTYNTQINRHAIVVITTPHYNVIKLYH